MCGIVGIINFKENRVNGDILKKMLGTLSHRGPDEKGFYVSENIGLGHARLKIIDLSERARQPMSNANKSIFITYNGEVYNYKELRGELISKGYKFQSESDTEVVLHAYEEWGLECLAHFIGMWAFVIWDAQKRILFASRDRLGIKPFYYFYNENIFIFASEIKTILEHPLIKRYADVQSIYEYLYLGYSLDDRTWIKGVHRLNPAYYLILDKGDLFIKRYWKPEINPDYSLSEEKASFGLGKLLVESVQLMLRADVEVGVHLSGGIDSSSITAIANRISTRKIRTFSGVFEEGSDFDEGQYIKKFIDKYGLINEKITIRPDNFIENMKKIIWHMDEPVVGPGTYSQFFLSKLINSRGIKVALGGQGGDELFGGYPHYYSGILSSIHQLMKSHKNNEYWKYYKAKDFCLKFAPFYLRRYLSGFLSLRRNRLGRILSKDIIRQINFDDLEERAGFYKGSFEEMELWDLNNYLPALLQVEDRLSMAFSVETRLPFLNHSLVEFALKIPFYLKLNSFNFKYILRIAMKNELPKFIFDRVDKKGFLIPVKAWLKDNKLCKDIASEVSIAAPRFFIDRELTWEKLNIELWLQMFKINL